MGFEDDVEKAKTSKKFIGGSKMTLQKAIELGEYNPEYLATFPEWHTLSKHVQFQFIRQGIDNRHRQLIVQWAEVNNVLDFRLKPEMKDALDNIKKQIDKLEEDREALYLEYSK